MKDDSQPPLSQANQRMPSSFLLFFPLQMHPEGHSEVPEIAVGDQSQAGHQHHRGESHEWEDLGKERGEPGL